VAERTGGWDRWDTGAAITFGLLAVGVVALDRSQGSSPWPGLALVLGLGPGSYFLARWTDVRSAAIPALRTRSRPPWPASPDAGPGPSRSQHVGPRPSRRSHQHPHPAPAAHAAVALQEPPATRLDEPPVETFR
jgi:hypothetical protein